MEITLTTELEELINEEMQTGNYFSPADVLREGLVTLRNKRIPKEVQRENLRQEVMKGYEQIRKGESITVDVNDLDKFAEEIMEKRKALRGETNGKS